MKIRQLIILLITAFAAAACSLIDDPVRPCPVEEERDSDVLLSFQLAASGSLTGSRTDDHTDPTHPEVDSEWRDFEDGIDFSDLGIFVFASKAPLPDGEAKGSEKLVFKTTNMKDDSVNIDGGPGAYYVDLKLSKSYLEQALETKLNDYANDPNIVFRIMIVANAQSLGTNNKPRWPSITGTTYKEIIDEFNNWNYNTNNIYNPNYTGNDVVEIYSNVKHNIPMFGTNTFMVTKDELYNSREDRKIYMGEIDLLRSLAKVRVVDNILNKTDDYPKIVGVKFSGSQYLSKPLPYNALTYQNGTQVHTPNISEPDNKAFINNGEFRLGLIPNNWVETDIKDHDGVTAINGFSTWIGFVPEQKIMTNKEVSGTSCPILTVTIANFIEDGVEDTKDYTINLYDQTLQAGIGGIGTAILRNHIYTILVDLKGTKLDCTVDLVPYIGVELNPDFGFDWLFPPKKSDPEQGE